jgi:hypothetical protein
MTTFFRVGLVLICITLILLLVQVPALLTSKSPPQPAGAWVYPEIQREAGFARLSISALGLLLALIPLRRKQLWAWFALAALALLYFLPVFVVPSLYFFRWGIPSGFATEAGSRVMAVNLLLVALMLVGLCLSLRDLLPSQKR